MVDGVPGEIPGVEGKLYAQLPIDIEYHGVMHAAKTPVSGRASLTGKRVGWRHSYNLIPRSSATSPWSSASAPSVAPSRSRTASWISSSTSRTNWKSSAAKRICRPTPTRSRNCRPARESFMTFADSASGRLLREVYDARVTADGGVRRAAGALPALNSEVPAPCRLFRRSDAPLISIAKPFRGLRGGNETPGIRPSFPHLRTAKEVTSMIQFSTPLQARAWPNGHRKPPLDPAPLNDSRPGVPRKLPARGHRLPRSPPPGFHFSAVDALRPRECPLGFGSAPGSTVSNHWIGLWAPTAFGPRASHLIARTAPRTKRQGRSSNRKTTAEPMAYAASSAP